MQADEATSSDWYRDFRVQAAISEVGMPDGTEEWLLDFTSTLLAITDYVADALAGYEPERIEALELQWRKALEADAPSVRLPNGDPALSETIDLLGLPLTARYLGEDVETVQRWRFPRANLEGLREAAARYSTGVSKLQAATDANVARRDLDTFLRVMQIPAPVTVCSDGRRVMPQAVRERILELGAAGVGTKAIMRTIGEEFPEFGTPAYMTVYMALRRAA